MTRILLTMALLGCLGVAACSGSDLGLDDTDSSIRIEAVGGNVISTPNNRGEIDMLVNGQRTFRIIRTVTQDGQSPIETNVTGEADFNFSNPDVASMNSAGVLTAHDEGFTELEVVYRDGDGDPSDDDTVYLDVTVRSII